MRPMCRLPMEFSRLRSDVSHRQRNHHSHQACSSRMPLALTDTTRRGSKGHQYFPAYVLRSGSTVESTIHWSARVMFATVKSTLLNLHSVETMRREMNESWITISHTILSNGGKGIKGRQWQRPNNERFKKSQANEYKAPFDPREDFHTYGCMVSRDEIVWYVDGVEVGRKKNQYWHRKMNVALSLGLRAPYAKFENNRLVPNEKHPANNLPTSMKVDYVRVWELVK